MSDPVIITVAITGALPRKKDTPAVPVTPSEQIESTHEAFGAGASLVHIHVRGDDEGPSSEPALFAKVTRVSRPMPEQVPSQEEIFGAFLCRYGAAQCARELGEHRA